MTTHSASINGLNLVYEKEGAGPPLVFFPGGGGSAVQWERVIPFFLSDYTCYTVEPRGQGRSDRVPDGDYRYMLCVADGMAFVQDIVGQPAVLVGQSLGGFTSMGVAARLPDLVRGVYSEDAVPHMYTGQGVPDSLFQFFRAVSDTQVQCDEHRWSVAAFAGGLATVMPAWAAANPAGLVDFARIAFGADPLVFRDSANGRSWVTAAEAGAIEVGVRCPVHVAQGDAALGAIVTDGHLQQLRDAGFNLTSTHFPGAGHMITATQLKPFIADLRAFLARIELPA